MLNSSVTGPSVGEKRDDAAVVFVPHHDCRHNLVDIKGAIVESANLTVLAAGIVDPNQRAIGFEKRVNCSIDLSGREQFWDRALELAMVTATVKAAHLDQSAVRSACHPCALAGGFRLTGTI